MRSGKDFFIAGIYVPFPSPYDIVANHSNFFKGATPNAGIRKHFHVPVSIRNGSILSCPTNLQA